VLHQPFVVFGPSHLIVLALTIFTPGVLILIARLRPSPRLEKRICRMFVAAILGIWTYWYVVAWSQGWLTWGDGLPLDLCSWAAIATVIALTGKNQTAFDLAYFWALAGTVQGILTPNLPYDFPEPRFVVFSIFHGGIIAAVLFMVFALKRRPYAKSIPKVLAWTLGYAGVAGPVDWLLNVNYGFLRAKPEHVSLFNMMPDWPYDIFVLVVMAILSVLIYYAPFFALDHCRRGKNHHSD
jgi:hypothetical integral membrane protein (TIGR02206 family)